MSEVNVRRFTEKLISNATDPIDYKRSIKKNSNIDPIDIAMHICRGFMDAIGDQSEVYTIEKITIPSARIYFLLANKTWTKEESISMAYQEGRVIAWKQK
jgi:hypothetical protein